MNQKNSACHLLRNQNPLKHQNRNIKEIEKSEQRPQSRYTFSFIIGL